MDFSLSAPVKVLLIGIVLLGYYLYLVVMSWTPDSSLVQVKGHVSSAKTYVSDVYDSHNHKSHYSELIFFLADGKQKYRIGDNIEDASYDDKNENYRRQLLNANDVTVWIRKTEKNDWQPWVFQIKADDDLLFSAEETRTKESRFDLLYLVLGLAAITAYVIITPNKLKAWFLRDGVV